MDEDDRRKLRTAIEAIRRGDDLDEKLLAPLFGHVPSRAEAAAARNRLESLRLASVEDAVEMVVQLVRRLPDSTSPLEEEERSVDELFRAVESGRALSPRCRHLLGILSRHHESVLLRAVREGEISREDVLACVHDGRALTERLSGRNRVRVPVTFRTTDFFGMPQVLREMHDEEVQFLDRVPVWTSGGVFRLLVSNESELRMAIGEPDTCTWLERTTDGSSVLWDVGANVGYFSLYAATRSPGARCVCFEPSPPNFARLHENVRINGLTERIIAFPVACSDVSGIDRFGMSFFYAGGWSQQGILPPEEVAAFKSHEGVFRIGCVTFALDEFRRGAEFLPAPTHLKIDVDGPEIKVLRGARELLLSPALRHLQVELRDDDEVAVATSILRERGFTKTFGPARGPGNRFYEKLPADPKTSRRGAS